MDNALGGEQVVVVRDLLAVVGTAVVAGLAVIGLGTVVVVIAFEVTISPRSGDGGSDTPTGSDTSTASGEPVEDPAAMEDCLKRAGVKTGGTRDVIAEDAGVGSVVAEFDRTGPTS